MSGEVYSHEAERAFLAAVMGRGAPLVDGLAESLHPSDFYIERNGWVWEAALALRSEQQPVDYTTLVGYLADRGKLEALGGSAYLVGIMADVVAFNNPEGYATIIRDHATLRRLRLAAGKIAQAAAELPVDEALALAEEQLDEVASGHVSSRTPAVARELSRVALNRVEAWMADPQEMRGQRFGFSPVDRLTGGFDDPTYLILAGATGSGKSTLARKLAMETAALGIPVWLYSFEDTAQVAHMAMLCDMARVPYRQMRAGTIDELDYQRVLEAAGRWERLSLFIRDQRASVRDVRADVLRERRATAWAQHGYGLVIVDTLDVLRDTYSTDNTRYNQVTSASAKLQALPGELGMMVLVTKQVNRAPAGRDDKRPRKEDLRDSGQVEEHARGIFGLYRPAYYYRTVKDAPASELEAFNIAALHTSEQQATAWRQAAELRVLKRSWGGPGDGAHAVRLAWVREIPAFYPVQED